MTEERLKIAVFIDFDNIEIGVKKTLNRHFDVGQVLEAIKERGEVVTKVAYGDWKHAADYSRAMTQHAVHMIQRNLTPGGDKNGADITLALDALEMAFTRSHINAFVIVGGDSDFIALVEKLKQYDKTVFVVGGRSFTSVILQKNCHEFIAYENLIGIQPAARKAAGRAPAASTAQLRDALPHLRRALEVLADREVSPQLGLLKSTLLQLDSTFSERDYGAHSFREFIQKMANAGFVTLKQVDRSLLVELKEPESGQPPAAPHHEIEEGTSQLDHRRTPYPSPGEETVPVAEEPARPASEETAPPAQDGTAGAAQGAAAVAVVRQILEQMGSKPHWPMYLRSFKHFLRSADPAFDERRFGLSSIHDLARQAQREGLLRVERNRQGILRIFPGEQYPQAARPVPPSDVEEPVPSEVVFPEPAATIAADFTPVPESVVEPAPGAPPQVPPEEPAGGQPEVATEGKPTRRRAMRASSLMRARKTPARKPRTSKKASRAENPSHGT